VSVRAIQISSRFRCLILLQDAPHFAMRSSISKKSAGILGNFIIVYLTISYPFFCILFEGIMMVSVKIIDMDKWHRETAG
jgi:hypothetical protein